MARILRQQPTSKAPTWKSQWPKNGDLSAWMICRLQKCEAITDVLEGSQKSHLPIDILGELGRTSEALKHLDRQLRRIPISNVLETIWLSEIGAKICLDAGNLDRMEKYLSIGLSTEKYNTRKCDRGFSINSVRKFRAYQGILDPEEAIDDEQRLEAIFYGEQRRCKDSLSQNKVREAKAALARMEQATNKMKDSSLGLRRQVVIELYAKVRDWKAVRRNIQKMTKDDREDFLDFDTLERIGMRAEAIADAIRAVKRRLAELNSMNSPNIHFPVSGICRALMFLVSQRKKREAQRLFAVVVKSAKKWPVFEQGWTTSAVFAMFAEVAAAIEGPEAAQLLIARAEQDARVEKRPGFRKGAVSSTLEMEARLGSVEDAIGKARKLRSPTERRRELCKLFTRTKQWNELRAICSEVASPEEAADICWTVAFEIRDSASKNKG